MAVRGLGLRMRVIATETQPDRPFVERHGIELVDFDTLLAQSDFLSLHCPLNNKTERMFNRSVFSRMKPGSVLINTARGGLVVEADLIEALKEGRLGGAGLDVFEQEPALAGNPLFQLENVVVSPHIGGADKLSQENMAIEAADCIIKLYRGDWPAGAVVNDELRATWKW
jgi:D-3-phosphoglycerate dehydrogenase